MERARKGLESLEHLRIAESCELAWAEPSTYKTINAVFEHSKKLYAGDAAGVLRVLEERKKAHNSASGGKESGPGWNAGDDDDSFHDRDGGSGCSKKVLAQMLGQSWVKEGHTQGNLKGRRVNAGTADKTSLLIKTCPVVTDTSCHKGASEIQHLTPICSGPLWRKRALSCRTAVTMQTSS